MSAEKTNWGYQSDNDESLKSKQGGKFGMNEALITKFEYNGLAGKDESPADAIDITISIADKEYRARIYDITGDLYKGDNTISPGEPGYIELYNAEKKQREAVIIHTIKAFGVTEDQIIAALKAGNVTDFRTWAIAMTGLKGAGSETVPVHAFLEYQWQIQEGNERTFLQLPKNMKGGRFLSPAIPATGSWNEKSDENGLRYVDDAGNEHPFVRSKNYMESPKANQQVEGQEDSSSTGEEIAGSTAKKSSW